MSTSATASSALSTRVSTAAGSAVPSLAAMMSCLRLSGSPRVVEIPPCAQSVLASSGFVAFVSKSTSAPSRAADRAAAQPAIPLPTTSTSVVSPSVVVAVLVSVSVILDLEHPIERDAREFFLLGCDLDHVVFAAFGEFLEHPGQIV